MYTHPARPDPPMAAREPTPAPTPAFFERVDQSRLEYYSESHARALFIAAYAAARGPEARIKAGSDAVFAYLQTCVIIHSGSKTPTLIIKSCIEDDSNDSVGLVRRPIYTSQPAASFRAESGVIGVFPEMELAYREIRGDGLPAGVPVPTAAAANRIIRAHTAEVSRLNIGSIWWESPNGRRRCKGTTFLPPPVSDADSQFYNIFSGLAIPREAAGDPNHAAVQEFKRHCLRLANGDQAGADWIINWSAGLVQRPAEKVRTALVLKGERGAGKGAFVEVLKAIIGSEYSRHCATAEPITGRFNTVIINALLVFLDEVVWAGANQESETLKKLITETMLEVEQKGIDAIKVHNRAHYIMATNNDWAVPAGKNERRYSVFEVSGELSENQGLSSRIRNTLVHGAQHIAAFLYEYKYDKNAANLIHETAALHDQQEQTMSGVEQWWLGCLESGLLEGAESESYQNNAFSGIKVPRSVMYNAFINFNRNKRYGQLPVITAFYKQLYKLCPQLKTDSMVSVDGRLQNSVRPPPIADARLAFRAATNYRGRIGDSIYVKPASLPPPPPEMIATVCGSDADDEMPPPPPEDSGCDYDSDAAPADLPPPPPTASDFVDDLYQECAAKVYCSECGLQCDNGQTECASCLEEIARQTAIEQCTTPTQQKSCAPLRTAAAKKSQQWSAPLRKSDIDDLLA
jgi:hypothetical protein